MVALICGECQASQSTRVRLCLALNAVHLESIKETLEVSPPVVRSNNFLLSNQYFSWISAELLFGDKK